ncbi:MAG: NAD(P)-dependent oxidoreductase [Jannaschia sp.]
MSPQRYLVTGATGFIGNACIRQLLNTGHEVAGLYRGDTPPDLDLPKDAVRWLRADLTDEASVSIQMADVRPTHMIALGWHMGPGNQQAVENFLWINYSIALLFTFAASGGERVVFCGSCMEYDWSQEQKLHETQTPLLPDTPYGVAKAALHNAYGSLCVKLGLSGAWARPFFLYGPHESRYRLAADVIISCLQEQPVKCSHGRQRRDFLHVADVAAAMCKLLHSDLTGAVNIGSGQAVPLSKLIMEAANQIGRPDLIQLGALPARANDVPLVEADTTRLRYGLGFHPQFSLKSGITDTIAWWRQELKRQVT